MLTEQFGIEKAGRPVNEIFLKFSIENNLIKGKIDLCVQQGLARPFDAETTATFFMHHVLQGIGMRVQQDLGREIPCGPTEMFRSLQTCIFGLGRLTG